MRGGDDDELSIEWLDIFTQKPKESKSELKMLSERMQ